MSKTETPQHTNRLALEKSPYLLQHAHNPVDWHPWGQEAFAKARDEDKMVLVSIGYATCHWCHVMERESFEDESLAAYLNAHFVAIKVDREERPDVDKIYMDALQAMGQQGGWPLNMFTTADGRPVIGGTYYPPQSAHGRPGFRELLGMLNDAWQNKRNEIIHNAETITEHLQKASALVSPPGLQWSHGPLDAAAQMYGRTYDKKDGGFALQQQNKFPPSMGLSLLMRHHHRTGGDNALLMVEATLRRMMAGGIYDQLGGGLSRYSTDHQWLVPHFEKMLYDNALFARALTEAYQVTGQEVFRMWAEDVLGYVLRDLSAPEGAFYSAEDADSEGEEGLFYVWTPEQVQAVLDGATAKAALAYWGIRPGGNFEHGRSILTASRAVHEVAAQLGIAPDTLAEQLGQARSDLLEARGKRIRPLRDDKVLTSWNALMISACAKAAVAFQAPEYLEAARRAAHFLRENLVDDKGRLLRRWREGEARYPGYLVDHASLANACLDLYEADLDPRWFDAALHLMREVNRLFRNDEGPYFDTGSDAERLITRTADGYDGVEPSGNSQAALAFLRLHAYGVREGFEADALRIMGGFRDHLEQAGVSFAAMLGALDLHLAPPQEVAIIGERNDPATQALLDVVQRGFHPTTVLAWAAPSDVETLGERIPLLQGRVAVGGKPTAYVCRDMACRLPVHTPEELARLL